MKLIHILSATVLASLILTVTLIQAGSNIPARLSYQGTLNNSDGTPVNTLKKMTFKIYSSDAATSPVWTEIQDGLYVTNGRFATVFGANTSNRLNISRFRGNTWLGITVDPDTSEMAPRQQLTSVAYAFNGVPRGGIIMWSGSSTNVPDGWALCNGTNGTPDLRGRFIVGAGSPRFNNYTGGSVEHFHKASNDGGDLRAAIGAPSGAPQKIGYEAIGSQNPNTNLPGYFTITSNDLASSNPGGSNPGYFTKVYGYTSNGFQGVPVFAQNNSARAGSLPPYYVLAYIMKL